MDRDSSLLLGFRPTRAALIGTTRRAISLTFLLVGPLACSAGSEVPGTPDSGRSAESADGNGGKSTAGGATFDPTADGGGKLTVAPDAVACSLGLPYKPQGCSCGGEDTAACWTGPAERRGLGKCHDGVQKCDQAGEFSGWGPCEGEEQDCGEDVPPAPEGCECVPGTTIACDEDCSTLVICSLTGAKTCQPDGTFGPCREQGLAGLANLLSCRNFFFGCVPGNFEGVYVGDCNNAFTCGHPPGVFDAPAPDAATPAEPDAGAPGLN